MDKQITAKQAKSTKSLFALATYFGAILALFCVSEFAMAATVGDLASNVTKSIEDITKLVTAAAYVAGIAFALTGMMKFKAHKDNPQQVPLSQPIVLLAIAAGLVFLPTLISSAGETVFESDAEAGGVEGTSEIP